MFSNPEVARLYRHRAPYPNEVLTTLAGLLVTPDTILDVGARTGALARRMLTFAGRVDAVDPSAAMIEEGRRLPGGADPRLRWITGRAESAPLSPPYGLVTAGASLHWVEVGVTPVVGQAGGERVDVTAVIGCPGSAQQLDVRVFYRLPPTSSSPR